jgi:hypothetical protein
MATAEALFNGSNGADFVAATGSATFSRAVDATNPPKLSTATPYEGASSLRWTSATNYGFQSLDGTPNNGGYFRYYLRASGAPLANVSLAQRTVGSWTNLQLIRLRADMKIDLCRANSTASWDTDDKPAHSTSAAAIPTGQYVRVEGYMTPTDCGVKVWFDPALTGTPDIDLSATEGTSYAGDAFWIGAGRYRLGTWAVPMSGTANTLDIDAFGYNSAGWLGPYVPPAEGPSFAGIVPI